MASTVGAARVSYLPTKRCTRGVQQGVASLDLLNPLPPPSRRLEGIREILCFVDDLTVAELHNAHRVCCSLLVRDGVFRDPEFPVSENPFDLEAGRLAGWPRFNSEKRLWVPYPLWVFTPPPHPAAFVGCVLCTPVVSAGANGGAVLLSFFLISIF